MAFPRQPLAQIFQLISRRQLTEPEQIAGLFEIGIVSQFVNVDTAVGQDALFPVDIADAGSGGDHSFQALSGLCGG